ncbi:hypothetical protein HQ447_05420 [bacterium]|nr:hypothetical protein [bacterium]
MSTQSFSLKNLAAVLGCGHESEEPAQGHGRGNARANPTQPPTVGDSRITEWARAAGRCLEAGDFAQSLDGGQVEDELSSIFRETPEFGRSLAIRLADFHLSDSQGALTLIGGGGEAVVFGDPANQQVIKLLGGAGKAGFGWTVGIDPEGLWILRPGGLAESLIRFALAEESFPTGLDLHALGTDGGFLLLHQPFLVGGNPTSAQLSDSMHEQGWRPFIPPTRLDMLATLTWSRGDIIATDVRPENAILAESDGRIYPFDFIVSRRN